MKGSSLEGTEYEHIDKKVYHLMDQKDEENKDK